MTVLNESEKSSGNPGAKALPRSSAMVASVFVHFLALVAIIILSRMRQPHIQAAKLAEVQLQAEPVYLPQNGPAGHGEGAPTHVRRKSHLPAPAPTEATEVLDPGKPLHEQAQRWTSAITTSLNFHGFYNNHLYGLAVLLSGDLPVITTDELPPHYQQYVIVEVTIDTKGRAAEVRLVAGEVEPQIERKILDAIRKFRYTPATRDGLAIPSQRDIVIHIPT